jgi:polyisoprenoid-binding protein YceI
MTPHNAVHCIRQVLAACALIAVTACSPTGPDAAEKSPAPRDAPVKPIAPDLPAGDYTLDKAHASLIFRVNHLGFSNFTGRFARYDAKLQFDPANLGASNVQVTIDPSSIETDNPPADFLTMLAGVEWLNAAQFPEMTFRSTHVESTSADTMRITGDLSLHGITRPIVLEASFNGGYAGHPMDPHARIGFSAHGVFKRSAFGISAGIPAPGTTMGVGDEVNVTIEAEFSGPAWRVPQPQA